MIFPTIPNKTKQAFNFKIYSKIGKVVHCTSSQVDSLSPTLIFFCITFTTNEAPSLCQRKENNFKDRMDFSCFNQIERNFSHKNSENKSITVSSKNTRSRGSILDSSIYIQNDDKVRGPSTPWMKSRCGSHLGCRTDARMKFNKPSTDSSHTFIQTERFPHPNEVIHDMPYMLNENHNKDEKILRSPLWTGKLT